MILLHTSPSSPFGRKVKLAASVLGLDALLLAEETNTQEPEEAFLRQNPLGKIPVLITEDGLALYDSRVILDYLDHRAGGGRIIPVDAGRFDVLRMQALADGLADAALLMVYEKRFRPEEMQYAPWLERQQMKVDRALAMLEAAPPQLTATLDAGAIALACALGYLDLRFDGAWRATHPRLIAWLDDFAARLPAFEQTKVAAS
ncbi:glutathione S-transferase [Breoghania corrubedonensis]|uniref:Glutathione S-transferase n=1 Tax=Breoghania corrubedonensis TaxID=665038 RepID=A0A2T5UNY0_9HYPH|nr:glutathione S-transferase family protein [Breoghania corrubedonensis]PTW53214.1 glutathione S-transferase [Breoghania corrubedonensis]